MDLNKLQRLAEKQKREKAKIEGKIETLMEELLEEGYNSISEAKEALKEANKKLELTDKIFSGKLQKFKEKYAEELQNLS